MRIFSHRDASAHYLTPIYSSVSSLIPAEVTEARLPICCHGCETNQQIMLARQMVISSLSLKSDQRKV